MAYHAGLKVQNITELLVEILSYTDMTFLLCVAPSIDKYWNTVVCHTPKLQQILFFKPIVAPQDSKLIFTRNPRKVYSSDPERVFVEMNSLLLKHFGKVFFEAGQPPYFRLKSSIAAFRDHLPWSSGELDGNAKPERTNLYEAFTYERASWRRMLVSQPPPPPILTILETQILCQDPGMVWKAHIYAEPFQSHFADSKSPLDSLDKRSELQGLRFGLLYDAVQSIAASCTTKPEKITHCIAWGEHHVLARRVELRPRNGVFVKFHIFEPRDRHIADGPKTIFDKTFRSKGFLPFSEQSYPSTQWAIV